MKRTSEMNDQEWRWAVEQQRHRIDEREEVVGRWKKKLSDANAELKGDKKRLDRLLRGEDADESIEEDPVLPFPGGEGEPERQRAAAGEREEADEGEPQAVVEERSAKRRAAKARKGPRGMTPS